MGIEPLYHCRFRFPNIINVRSCGNVSSRLKFLYSEKCYYKTLGHGDIVTRAAVAASTSPMGPWYNIIHTDWSLCRSSECFHNTFHRKFCGNFKIYLKTEQVAHKIMLFFDHCWDHLVVDFCSFFWRFLLTKVIKRPKFLDPLRTSCDGFYDVLCQLQTHHI